MNTNTKTLSINDIDFKAFSKECKTQEDLSVLTKQFMKSMIEEMLQVELEDYLEQKENDSKNGTYPKTIHSDTGELRLNIPRDILKGIRGYFKLYSK